VEQARHGVRAPRALIAAVRSCRGHRAGPGAIRPTRAAPGRPRPGAGPGRRPRPSSARGARSVRGRSQAGGVLRLLLPPSCICISNINPLRAALSRAFEVTPSVRCAAGLALLMSARCSRSEAFPLRLVCGHSPLRRVTGRRGPADRASSTVCQALRAPSTCRPTPPEPHRRSTPKRSSDGRQGPQRCTGAHRRESWWAAGESSHRA